MITNYKSLFAASAAAMLVTGCDADPEIKFKCQSEDKTRVAKFEGYNRSTPSYLYLYQEVISKTKNEVSEMAFSRRYSYVKSDDNKTPDENFAKAITDAKNFCNNGLIPNQK